MSEILKRMQAEALLLKKDQSVTSNVVALPQSQMTVTELEEQKESGLSVCATFVKGNYQLHQNEINGRFYFNDGREITDREVNTIAITASTVKTNITPSTVHVVLNSDFTPRRNPLKEYFELNKPQSIGHIEKMFSCFGVDEKWLPYFQKWMVGVVAGIYGRPNPLVLVLIGEKQNEGKTRWFEDLLPKEINPYYSTFNHGHSNQKDEDLMMVEKLLILDDEFGNKTAKDIEAFKARTSKPMYSIRRPYGRQNEDMKRLASLCGTSNNTSVINDLTGNRRIVPINLTSIINFEIKESVNRDELWAEAYHLYYCGFNCDLTSEEIKNLNEWGEDNTVKYPEEELILDCYDLPSEKEGEIMCLSASDILNDLNLNFSLPNLNQNRIGKVMKKIGFKQQRTKKKRGYLVVVNQARLANYNSFKSR